MTANRTPLKVYVTHFGIHEVIVAAKSQREALAAWGVTRNLFSKGHAFDTRDKEVCAVALAAPGQVFARPRGSDKPFKPVNDKAAVRADGGLPDDEAK